VALRVRGFEVLVVKITDVGRSTQITHVSNAELRAQHPTLAVPHLRGVEHVRCPLDVTLGVVVCVVIVDDRLVIEGQAVYSRCSSSRAVIDTLVFWFVAVGTHGWVTSPLGSATKNGMPFERPLIRPW